ncbi:MAG: putative nicotinate-nucleotide adenylyltransferase [Acidimicrobiia bacterium]|nr:MAG: putative nicotinate-nucleotide adenylyltransferase [Acidimicrobiia bacterium]
MPPPPVDSGDGARPRQGGRPTAGTERLGILGGTFDPVHVGHLVAAVEARHQLALDRVLLVVAADPWQKHGRVVAPAADRYALVETAVDGVDALEPCALEMEREGPTYTIDTVERLRDGARSLYLVVGADLVAGLPTWHRVDELRRAVTLAVVGREGEAVASVPGWDSCTVTMPRLDVSSTDLRDRIARGAPFDYLVPTPAARILRARALYGWRG